MSANLINSITLTLDEVFKGMVQAAITEYALAHPNDPLARSMVRDPAYLIPMFTSVVADNATISADDWEAKDDASKQNDVRYALAQAWPLMSGAIPNIEPETSRVPILAADPDVTSALSIWVDQATGELRIRDKFDNVHAYQAAA